MMDVEELPEYVEKEEKEEEKEESEKQKKMPIKIRQFRGQEPTQIWIDPKWTVEQVEKKLAKAWKKNPRACRLALNGRPLPQKQKFTNLSSKIEGKVLETIADHPVGHSD